MARVSADGLVPPSERAPQVFCASAYFCGGASHPLSSHTRQSRPSLRALTPSTCATVAPSGVVRALRSSERRSVTTGRLRNAAACSTVIQAPPRVAPSLLPGGLFFSIAFDSYPLPTV